MLQRAMNDVSILEYYATYFKAILIVPFILLHTLSLG
jgi:hypothetical protein